MKPALAFIPAAAALLLAACGSSSSSSSGAAATAAPTTTTTATSSAASTGKAAVMITPSHGKVGTVVHVVGSGYSPGVQVTGTLCTVNATGGVDNPLTDCDVVNTDSVTTDTSGGFTTDYTVKRIPTPAKAAYTIGFGVQGDNANSAGAVFTVDS